MGSQVDSKATSCCAREVALCANKGLLSAVNQYMSFQEGRCVTREVAFVAIVFFLCIRMILVDFGHLVYQRVLRVSVFGITEKNQDDSLDRATF